MAAPDDFIDTTITEEIEGSSYTGVDFERQELRVIFETMDNNNVFYKMLSEDQIVSWSKTTAGFIFVVIPLNQEIFMTPS